MVIHQGPPSAGEVSAPVVGPDIFNANMGAGSGGMNEFPIAHINADMRKGSAQGVEKQKVPWLDLRAAHALQAWRIGLIIHPAGQNQPQAMFINIMSKTTAIKAIAKIIPPHLIGNTEKIHGRDE